MLNWQPDWTAIWTAAEVKTQIPEFGFTGPGWYFKLKESCLVIPVDFGKPGQTPWQQIWPKSTRFSFFFFSCDPTPGLNAIANAPVREDCR